MIKSPGPLVYLFLVLAVIITTGCTSVQPSNTVKVTLLHLNDVYEIAPISGGKSGGLARVATLRKQLLLRNPNTITLLGGDYLSPSAMGTAVVNGERLAGKQMVDVLNALGLDYATFGNHEFDVKRDQFTQRLKETKFAIISSNVRDDQGKPWPNISERKVLTFTNNAGKSFKLGIFGVTLDSNKADYLTYRNVFDSADEQISKLKGQSDFILALTHQSLKDDERLIRTYPEVDLVLGGHEHENYQRWRGNDTPVLKADANARSVYVVDLEFNPGTGKTRISPRIVFINDSIDEDPVVNDKVQHWIKIVFDSFKAQGFDPEEVLAKVTKPLDGLESSVRNRSTNLTRLIAESMLLPYPQAELSIYNSGSIRIDDNLAAGDVTVYDVIRALPFGGTVPLVEIKGALLIKVLDQGMKNIGTGGFLQGANIKRDGKQWMVQDKAIREERTYKVAIAEFLLTGHEAGLDFLTPKNPGLSVIDDGKKWDIRKLVSDKFRALKRL